MASKQPDSELAQERKNNKNHKHREGSPHQASWWARARPGCEVEGGVRFPPACPTLWEHPVARSVILAYKDTYFSFDLAFIGWSAGKNTYPVLSHLLYCTPRGLCFWQTKCLWEPCIEWICRHRRSDSICSLCVILAIFQIFHYYPICYGDLWSGIMTSWRLAFFSHKVFFN